jgi:hypothetical protein
MTEHEERGHHRDHHTHSQEVAPTPPWLRRAHRDWRLWVVVGLMLIGIVIYVLSFDEALQPGGQVKDVVPAAP